MRKKIPPCGGPGCLPDTDVVSECGTVTPEMEKIPGSIDNPGTAIPEKTEQLLREAVGKLFIAALEQLYVQTYGKQP